MYINTHGGVNEKVLHDSITPPEEFVNCSEDVQMSLSVPFGNTPLSNFTLMYVTSTARYHEGADFHFSHHGYYNYTLLLTLTGCGKILFRGRTIRVRRGDVILFNNLEPLEGRTDTDDWTFSAINLSGDPCRMYDRLWNQGTLGIFHTKDPEQFEDYRRRINRFISQMNLQGDLEVNRLLTILLTDLLVGQNGESDISERQPQWITKAAAYIAAHYEEPLYVPKLAEQFHVSQSYFTHQFKKYMRRTPKEYLRLCRMDEAALLLQGTNIPVVDIAARVGYSSQSRFSEVFHLVYGESPTDFRKNKARNV